MPSPLRILLVVIGVVVTLVGTSFLLVTQPVAGSLPFGGDAHADPERLRSHVEFLTRTVHPRDSDHPGNLDRAAAYVRERFLEAGARVREQPFEARGVTYRNVIGSFGPEEGARVVVGAHYDAFGEFGDLAGADDNASGTAGLLELARLLRVSEVPIRVDLVAFSTEEPPYFGSQWMGSAVHAGSLREEGVELWGMICLEMIGYFTERQPWPSLIPKLLYPSTGDFVMTVGRLEDRRLARHVARSFRGASGVRAFTFIGPRGMGIDASDHRSYWDEGYPAVMVTDTAFIRNPHYHAPTDTAETLDYRRMAAVVDGVSNAVIHAAG